MFPNRKKSKESNGALVRSLGAPLQKLQASKVKTYYLNLFPSHINVLFLTKLGSSKILKKIFSNRKKSKDSNGALVRSLGPPLQKLQASKVKTYYFNLFSSHKYFISD